MGCFGAPVAARSRNARGAPSARLPVAGTRFQVWREGHARAQDEGCMPGGASLCAGGARRLRGRRRGDRGADPAVGFAGRVRQPVGSARDQRGPGPCPRRPRRGRRRRSGRGSDHRCHRHRYRRGPPALRGQDDHRGVPARCARRDGRPVLSWHRGRECRRRPARCRSGRGHRHVRDPARHGRRQLCPGVAVDVEQQRCKLQEPVQRRLRVAGRPAGRGLPQPELRLQRHHRRLQRAGAQGQLRPGDCGDGPGPALRRRSSSCGPRAMPTETRA